MKEGYYIITMTNSAGVSTTAKLFVRDNQIIGEGISFSFYGSIHFKTMVLNVSRNKASTYSPILGDYIGYSFLGALRETPEGYDLELDAASDLFVNIRFTRTKANEGDECSMEFID